MIQILKLNVVKIFQLNVVNYCIYIRVAPIENQLHKQPKQKI